ARPAASIVGKNPVAYSRPSATWRRKCGTVIRPVVAKCTALCRWNGKSPSRIILRAIGPAHARTRMPVTAAYPTISRDSTRPRGRSATAVGCVVTRSDGSGCTVEDPHGVYDAFDVGVAELVVKREPKQSIADVFGHRAVAWAATHLRPHAGEVQRKVVKEGHDAARLEMCDERLPNLQRGEDHIEHMVRLLAVGRHDRQSHRVGGGPVGKP